MTYMQDVRYKWIERRILIMWRIIRFSGDCSREAIKTCVCKRFCYYYSMPRLRRILKLVYTGHTNEEVLHGANLQWLQEIVHRSPNAHVKQWSCQQSPKWSPLNGKRKSQTAINLALEVLRRSYLGSTCTGTQPRKEAVDFKKGKSLTASDTSSDMSSSHDWDRLGKCLLILWLSCYNIQFVVNLLR